MLLNSGISGILVLLHHLLVAGCNLQALKQLSLTLQDAHKHTI